MNPSEAIVVGCRILDPVMTPAGFTFVPGTVGKGSGGNFASASYLRDDRRLDFSYRCALGAVEYHIGDLVLDHNSYMRLLGVWSDSEYSRFSRDAELAGFEALRNDLERYCADFLVGPGEEFRRLAKTPVPHGNMGL
jgi:hypothetical protein